MARERNLQRCAAHGLHFDASAKQGCVLCEKARAERRHPAAALAGLALVLIAAAGYAAPRLISARAAASPAAPGSAGDAGVDAAAVAAPAPAPMLAAAPTPVRTLPAPLPADYPPPPPPGTHWPQAVRVSMDPSGNTTADSDPRSDEGPCDQGDPVACESLWGLLKDPLRAQAARLRAFELHRCAAAGGNGCSARSRQELGSVAANQVRSQCSMGSGPLCAQLAEMYAKAEAPDLALVADLRRAACERGSATACNDLAGAYATGSGTARDEQKALEVYARASKLNLDSMPKCSAPHCEELQHGLVELADSLRRAELAPQTVEQECARGSLEACQGLALVSERSNPARAAEFQKQADVAQLNVCDREPSAACIRPWLTQLRRPAEYDHGKNSLEQLCAREEEACWALGWVFSKDGAFPDPAVSSDYNRRALTLAQAHCDSGSLQACQELTRAYRWGHGAPRDESQAKAYQAKADRLREASLQRHEVVPLDLFSPLSTPWKP